LTLNSFLVRTATRLLYLLRKITFFLSLACWQWSSTEALVVGVKLRFKVWKTAPARDLATQIVVAHIQVTKIPQLSDLVRYAPIDLIVAYVQILKILRVLHICKIKRQLVFRQYNLSHRLRLSEQKRSIPSELVASQIDICESNVPKRLGDGALQSVGRKVEIGHGACKFAEERIRNCSGELVTRQVDSAEVDKVSQR